MRQQRGDRQGSQTVQRALEVLDAVGAAPPLRLSEVAKRVGLNISTTSRLLTELERFDYVRRDVDTGRYHLGFKFLQMAHALQEQTPLPELARPVLAELVERTGETATINVLQGDRAMIIARSECRSPLRTVAQIGTRGPFYCTAAGKLLLAHLPEEEIRRVLAQPMPRLTDLTITEPQALSEELSLTRARGYALDRGERETGLIGLAAPVRDATGGVVASCGVSGSEQRMRPETIPVLAAAVVDEAMHLSQLLGWQAPAGDSERSGIRPPRAMAPNQDVIVGDVTSGRNVGE